MKTSTTTSTLIYKAITWQLLGLVTSLLITYVYTGSVATSAALTITMTTCGLVMYIIHEKLWSWLAGRGLAKQP